MDKKLIKSATKKLELLNIVLHEAHLTRNPSHEDASSYPSGLKQQEKLGIQSDEIVYETDKKKFNLLRVYVSLGNRAVSSEKQGASPTVFYSIEATFRVDYLVKGELSKGEVREFSEFNSVHNVWPFWRQHVFTTVKIAELPHVDVPLMRGILSSRKKPSAKKIV
jgi:hypothetical protein